MPVGMKAVRARMLAAAALEARARMVLQSDPTNPVVTVLERRNSNMRPTITSAIGTGNHEVLICQQPVLHNSANTFFSHCSR